MTPDERNALVEKHLPLATYFARKFQVHGLELDDLVQEARTGLIDAADRFDPGRGVKFSTYAAWHVRKTIMEAIRTKNDVVRTPRRHSSVSCVSLEVAADLADTALAPHESLAAAEEVATIRNLIKKLPPREAIVIRLRHGINTERLTLRKTGDILGVSPERVRQIQAGAEEKLRALALDCATLGRHGAITAEHPKESAQPESE